MNIFFFNLWHIGDMFFAQPGVKCVCQSNPGQLFHVLCRYNTNLYESIPNAKIVLDTDAPDLVHALEQHQPLYGRINEDTIGINTWIGAMFPKYGHDIECNPLKLFVVMQDMIRSINQEYGLSLKYDMDTFPLYRRLPDLADGRTGVARFEEWIQLHPQKPRIFYYNYFAMSGQIVQINMMSEHDDIIRAIAGIFKDAYIIVPNFTSQMPDNVIHCDNVFGTVPTKTCENITHMAMIADACDVSVHYNIGACFYYMNCSKGPTTSTKIHVCAGHTRYYFDTFQSIIDELQDNMKLRVLDCNNARDVVKKLIPTIYGTLGRFVYTPANE